jgi:signal recognition particle subunit SRP54
MFSSLTEKFQSAFSLLQKEKTLTESNIQEAVKQIRLALLDADVNFSVVSQLIKKVKEESLGEKVIKSVRPQEQFVAVMHEALCELMGKEEPKLNLKHDPSVIMLCGLQGAGKTTQAAKLAAYLKGKEFLRRPLLVACDLQRPGAVLQLMTLGAQIDVPVFAVQEGKSPVEIAKLAIEKAKREHYDTVIIDTAGRLHVDEALMHELVEIKNSVNPHEVLFVANAAYGQDAVKTAVEFDQKVEITGSILTMLDGTTRAGAALSIVEVTKKPLKFEGIGEKISDFQLFNPQSMADRILGMGDVINLVKKAQEHFDENEAKKLEEKIKKASFTYEDYLSQMAMVKKMGSLKGIMKMMPGFSEMGELDVSEKEFQKIESIILSMTKAERQGKVELEMSRRRRLAAGSGTSLGDVNKLVKGFKRLKQIMKDLPILQKKMAKSGFNPQSMLGSQFFNRFFS